MQALADADVRSRIATALDETLVVEAAAGTGKTTELVTRIVSILAAGRATVEAIVAVTFTEKAAGELKLRLREAIERERERRGVDAGVQERLNAALGSLEEAHVTTIHGFCADLLRERPVEARIDPQFQVLTEAQAERLYNEAFYSWFQDALQAPGEGLRRSLRRSSRPTDRAGAEDGPTERLRRAGLALVEWRDFPKAWQRNGFDRGGKIDELVAELHALADLTANPSQRGDNLFLDTRPFRQLSAELRSRSADEPVDYDGFEAALVDLSRNRELRRARKGSGRWYSSGVDRTKLLADRERLMAGLAEFRSAADADLAALLHEELRGSIDRYETLKAREGALDFLDLLLRARNLVRDCEPVRRRFQERFSRIFVDEFQDTDPLQAEILLLLASDDPAVSDWRSVTPVPGKLFLVGDPKQSIYRFRRADVGAYLGVCELLEERGAIRVPLTTSFRSTPSIQNAINAAFEPVMTGDKAMLQAGYVSLRPDRPELGGQPSIVALPVPAPYATQKVAASAIGKSLPHAVGAFIHWLVTESKRYGWKITERGGDAPVHIEARHICVLFRRFVSWDEDITRPYVEAMEAHGVPHLLVGGRAFHDREEIETMRAALSAIEWPDDELSVFATLRGSLFAIGDEELLEYRDICRTFHPFRVPIDLPAHLQPVADALRLLKDLHGRRNARPAAETINRLLGATRAHVGLVLRNAGEQVLANVLHVAELARQYEASGGISFRGFVEELRSAASGGRGQEAPILEEGSDGVRLMTVHKAKGLEFPVVILADIAAKLRPYEASRFTDPSQGLCALKIGGWSPVDLINHEAEELAREEAEGVRIAYVAATRARDLLVIPAVGDEPWEGGWVSPLNAAIYPPPAERRTQTEALQCPPFKKDSVLIRPNGDPAMPLTVCPGLHRLPRAGHEHEYPVLWWDPSTLDLGKETPFGLRRDDLIVKHVDLATVETGLATYASWRDSARAARARGSEPSIRVQTASEWAASGAPLEDGRALPSVNVVEVPGRRPRPGGRRYGTLVHALLATVPLDAEQQSIRDLAGAHGRVFGASDEEVQSAVEIVEGVLREPLLARARKAMAAGRCRRESPVALNCANGALIEGVIDLAFEEADGFTVLDFKTDRDLERGMGHYTRQLQFYAEAIRSATGRSVTSVLMRI